jgi:hypothetical protein
MVEGVAIIYLPEVGVARVGWAGLLFRDDLPVPPHFYALGVLVRALVDPSADLTSRNAYTRLWQVLLYLALALDSQTVSQTESRQAAIQVLVVLRRLSESPGDSHAARLSLGLVLLLLPSEALVLSAGVVYDTDALAVILEIVGVGLLHPSVLISLVSSSMMVIWVDRITQPMG